MISSAVPLTMPERLITGVATVDELESPGFLVRRSHSVALYDGALRFADAELGRLLEHLAVRGLRAFMQEHNSRPRRPVREDPAAGGIRWNRLHPHGCAAPAPRSASDRPRTPSLLGRPG